MDISLVVRGVVLLESGILIWYAFRKTPDSNFRILFSLMIFLFFLSLAIFLPSGNISDWISQIPFYAGEIVLYLLVKEIIDQSTGQKVENQTQTLPLMLFGTAQSYFGFSDWLTYLTSQGFQYIVSLPLAIFVVIYIWVRRQYIEEPFLAKSLLFFILGLVFLTLMNVSSFLILSQNFFPLLVGAPFELLKFVLFSIGFFCFGLAVSWMSRKQ